MPPAVEESLAGGGVHPPGRRRGQAERQASARRQRQSQLVQGAGARLAQQLARVARAEAQAEGATRLKQGREVGRGGHVGGGVGEEGLGSAREVGSGRGGEGRWIRAQLGRRRHGPE